MKPEETREKLIEILDQGSEITVLAEPDEPGVLDKLFAVFREFAALLDGSEYETLSGHTKNLVNFLDKASEGDEDVATAFKVCIEAIIAFQGIVRDGRSIEEVEFPAELEYGIVAGENPGIAPVGETCVARQEPGPGGDDGVQTAGFGQPEPVADMQPEAVQVTEAVENNKSLENRSSSGATGEDEERRRKPGMTTGNDVLEQGTKAGDSLKLEERAGKYLTFGLGDEEYGLEILKVQEIIKMMEITRVPRTPEFVRGVINLRGKVIPVIDLRTKFGLPSVETTEKTCVIVVQVAREAGQVTMGIIVDEVSEVLDISAECMEPTPEFGTSVDTAFILGMGKLDKKVVMLLDVDKVLSSSELASLNAF